MSIQGIAAGADQIADGEDPSILATVDENGDLHVTSNTVTQDGVSRSIATDSMGRAISSDSDKLTAILIEMRIQTEFLRAIAAGQISIDDPDMLRLEADATGLARTLS